VPVCETEWSGQRSPIVTACEQGNAADCTYLGNAFLKSSSSENNVATAAKLLQRGCDLDDGLGCTFLGDLYKTGRSHFRQDPAKAAALYRRAWAKGDAKGCISLGQAYEQGAGVLKDYSSALESYRLACLQHGQGCSEYYRFNAQSQKVTN